MIFTKIVVIGRIVGFKDNNHGFVLKDDDGELLFFIDEHYLCELPLHSTIKITIEDEDIKRDDTNNVFYGFVEHYQPGGFYYSQKKHSSLFHGLLSIDGKGMITYTKKDLSDLFEENELLKITIEKHEVIL